MVCEVILSVGILPKEGSLSGFTAADDGAGQGTSWVPGGGSGRETDSRAGSGEGEQSSTEVSS